jgi:cytochrome c biogenesis protein CcmG/thiol:disulfide interchange protein DsbE
LLEDLPLKIEEFQFCPKCGAAFSQGAGSAPEGVPTAVNTVTCGACGTTLQASDFTGVGSVPLANPQGNRNPLALVVVAVVAAAMLYFGMHMARRSGTAAASSLLTKSSEAPDFSLEQLDGKSMRLSDLRGKAVLLNFWATWCGPCKIETPWLVELQNQYGHDGLQVVGVEMGDDGKDEITKFMKDMGMNYPVLIGKEAVGEAYGGVPALPETFFIGRDGKIVDKIIGLKGKGEIEDSIKKALDTPVGNSPATAATASTADGPK